jgi:hypothetical protein
MRDRGEPRGSQRRDAQRLDRHRAARQRPQQRPPLAKAVFNIDGTACSAAIG